MSKRSYKGDPLDMTYTPITERPELDKDAEDVVYATEAENEGTETTENVPVPESPESPEDSDPEDEEPQRPVVPGQTTLTEWGGTDE